MFDTKIKYVIRNDLILMKSLSVIVKNIFVYDSLYFNERSTQLFHSADQLFICMKIFRNIIHYIIYYFYIYHIQGKFILQINNVSIFHIHYM